MPLTILQIKNAAPEEKLYKLSDGGGLYLAVTPAGGKLWRLKYRINGKEKLLSLGPFPQVSLAEARTKRDEQKKLLTSGVDPARKKREDKAAALLGSENSFRAVALEYIAKRESEGLAAVTTNKERWMVDKLGSHFGSFPIGDIRPVDLLSALKALEGVDQLETLRKTHGLCSRIFRYAIATLRAERDVAADLKGAFKTPRAKHFAAILDPQAFGELLRAIDAYTGQPATVWALKIAPHVFVRPGELRQAEWSEIDLEAAVWRIPPSRMKMGKEHAVPLSRQVVEILTAAKELTGRHRYVFPALGNPKRPMSENTLNAALRRMGFAKEDMSSHGFRSTASTLLNESGRWSPDAIERALAHGDSNAVRGIYSRGAFWNERVEMAQWWSDYLDQLKSAARARHQTKGSP